MDEGCDADARALILGSHRPSRLYADPTRSGNGEDDVSTSTGYTPMQVSHYYRRSLTVYAKHVGVSLLLDAAASKPNSHSDAVRPGRGLCPIEFLREHMRWLDVELRKEEINRAFFLKRTSYAKAKEEHLEKIRAALAIERAVEETHAPTISAYAKQSSAPKGINDFFPRGMEWKKMREKKLKAKREKLAAESAENEAEIFVPWKLSDENKRILEQVAARRDAARRLHEALEDSDAACEDDAVRDGGRRKLPTDSSPVSSARMTLTHSPSRTCASSYELRSDHHHPCISSRSRELTKDLPPFEYRMQVALERKKTRLLQAAFEVQQRELHPEGIEEVRQGPMLPEGDIRSMVDRLHRSPRATPLRDKECTFRPEVNRIPEFEHVSPRVYTPTRRQLTAAALSASSPSAASVKQQDHDTASHCVRTSETAHRADVSPSQSRAGSSARLSSSLRRARTAGGSAAADVGTRTSEQDTFLLRAGVWASIAAQHRADDKARAEQRFAAEHSFHPCVCPESSQIVRTASQRRTAAPAVVPGSSQYLHERRGNGDTRRSSGPWDPDVLFSRMSARELSYSPVRQNAPVLRSIDDSASEGENPAHAFGQTRNTNTPAIPPDALRYLLRYGLHGKPTESPRRSDPRRHSQPRGSSRQRADTAGSPRTSNPQPSAHLRARRSPLDGTATSSLTADTDNSESVPLPKDIVADLLEWWRRMANLSDGAHEDPAAVSLPRGVVLVCLDHLSASVAFPPSRASYSASGGGVASRGAASRLGKYVSFPQFIAAVSDVLVAPSSGSPVA